jgi:thioesterase domain-containing protein
MRAFVSRRAWLPILILCALDPEPICAQGQLQPTRSVVDYLKSKNLPSALSDRKQLFVARFGAAEAYVGSTGQNIRLLRALVNEESVSAPQIAMSVFQKRPNAIIALIGGFGWGSRASSPPDIWKYDQGPEVEADLFELFEQQVPSNWDEANSIAEKIKAKLDADKTRPVVLIGHSFGASGAVETAKKLQDLGVSVDLLVAIDAINSNNPLAVLTTELQPPNSVAVLVHVAAGQEHWAIGVANVVGTLVEYRVADTDHTSVDNVLETHDILRELMARLPEKGINKEGFNTSPADYTPVAPPTDVNAIPGHDNWSHAVAAVSPN